MNERLGFLIILLQNILFWKEFLACNGCFGLFSKIKKGSGTSLWCTFSAWFFHKNIPYLILYQWTMFHCHNSFPSQDMKHVLFSNGWQGKKEGKTNTQKLEYLENEKSILDEIKTILKGYHLVKNKILIINTRHKL